MFCPTYMIGKHKHRFHRLFTYTFYETCLLSSVVPLLMNSNVFLGSGIFIPRDWLTDTGGLYFFSLFVIIFVKCVYRSELVGFFFVDFIYSKLYDSFFILRI